MQPPALVEPASVSHTEQAWSSIAIERMSAARAASRLVKLILRIASITGRASKAAMSTCSTVVVSSSALVLVGAFIGSTSLPSPLRGGGGGGGLECSVAEGGNWGEQRLRRAPPAPSPSPH